MRSGKSAQLGETAHGAVITAELSTTVSQRDRMAEKYITINMLQDI